MPAAAEVVEALLRRGETVATCESLTAGLVAATLADVPGCSAVLRGGLVTYATDLKTALAGVPEDVTAAGVVSQPCAEAMAAGVRERCRSTWGVATTGVAGPGPHDGVAAGTAWVAVAGPDEVVARRLELPGDRAEVRRACVAAALALLAERLG